MKVKDILELDRLYEWTGGIVEWGGVLSKSMAAEIAEIYCEPRLGTRGFRYDIVFKGMEDRDPQMSMNAEDIIYPIYEGGVLIGIKLGEDADLFCTIKKPLNFVRGLKLKNVNELLVQA